jgi:hypothetical protein
LCGVSRRGGLLIYQAKVPLTILAGLLLLLVLAGILLNLGNQSLRVDVSERQQFIAQSMQLEGLHREIITTLITAALKTNDEKLKGLLSSQGISFGVEPEPATRPAAR